MAGSMANPDLRRKIKVKKRPDLVITTSKYGGQTFFIVKDPVSLRYYRFREEELFLLSQFDGKRNFDDVRHEFVERFRPQRLSVQELEKFVQQLLQAGIATVDTPQIGQRLYERYKDRMWQKFKGFFSNILFLKVPIFDPERFLVYLLKYTKFLFTMWFFIPYCMFALSSLLLVIVNWNLFMSKLPKYEEFFNFRNVLYFWVTLAIIKVLHEFGHGLSCKRFGGEVHEMGFLFLVLTPCLYCNVTDSWMLPSKWHRAIIGAAGMYVELIIASVFVWLWWYSQPGFLNTLFLTIVFICSVSTIMFNGNPLLRYDGYYILSDLMEIPNLRERSSRFLGNVASIIFFGKPAVEDPYMPKKHKWFFIVYAIAAFCYRMMITFGIAFFFYRLLQPYGLAILSQFLAVLSLIPLACMPTYRAAKTLKMHWREMKVNKARMVASVATGVVLLIALIFVPLPMSIDVPMVVQAKDATSIFVRDNGNLQTLFVTDGQEATEGMLLARLENPDLQMEQERLRLELGQLRNQQQRSLAFGDFATEETIRQRANSTLKQLESVKRQLATLELVVPTNVKGTVMSPPEDYESKRSFKIGEVFCQIGDPKKLEAQLIIEHKHINLITEGMPVSLKFAGHIGSIQDSTIAKIATTPISAVPPSMSNKHGGHVATQTDPQTRMEVPLLRSYSLKVDIPDTDSGLVPGLRGFARIDVGYRSLYWRMDRYMQQTFHFGFSDWFGSSGEKN